jgi:hypothetical protein
LVKPKLADGETPLTEAVTVYEPTVEFATAVTLAEPLASVVTVVPERVADAPVVGAANVTETPLSRLLKESVTTTWRGTAKGARTVVLCGVPATVWITAGAPAEIVKGVLCVDAREVADAVSW